MISGGCKINFFRFCGFRSNVLRPDGFWSHGFSSDGFRSDGFGPDCFRSDGFSSDSLRSDDFRSDGFRSDNFRSDGFSSDGFRSDGFGPDNSRTDSSKAGDFDSGGKDQGARLLRVENLDFYIDDVHILKDISFKAKKGEFIGLIGPNGAGKTTLLKCISGINRGNGRVELDGRDIRTLNSRQIASKTAMLHQNTVVAFPFTVLDIVLTGRYHKLGRFRPETPADYAVARRCMEYTDTLKLKNRLINTLSGGERQRVLFARVLAQETDLILLDEPSASLDIAYEEQLFKYARELSGSGKAVIAAVHDLKTALRYCTRLIVMKDGRIIADGVPESVITRKISGRRLVLTPSYTETG